MNATPQSLIVPSDENPRMSTARQLIAKNIGQGLSTLERGQSAVELASVILSEANRIQTSEEKVIQAQLARMMDDPKGKIFTTCMTDECFRSDNAKRIADQIDYLLHKHGVPQYLDPFARLQMSSFQVIGKPLANQIIPLVKSLIRKETAKVIIPGEADKIEKHIAMRRQENITTNLNHLGEAILGEEEAQKRLNAYVESLKAPHIEYISVKISTIFSQLNVISWEETLTELKERLRLLYRTAMENTFTDKNGKQQHKFINLDMEEYRDLALTCDLFQQVLDEDEFLSYRGGIVLQAYLPDAYEYMVKLVEWSKKRRLRGGAAIKVRLVKGANLAMELVETSMRHWDLVTFSSKIEVDANYKKILDYVCTKENAEAVNIGIASHNLFDLAYSLILRAERGVEAETQFEMLEGMAEHIRQVIKDLSGELVLYCPAAEAHEFQHAIAYLIRRLDENTAPDNFLRHAFDLEPNTAKFVKLQKFFLKSCELVAEIDVTPRRQQNRLQMPTEPTSPEFDNEADTDFAIENNRQWVDGIYKKAKEFKAEQIPLVINGRQFTTDKTQDSIDPSTAQKSYTYSLAEEKEIEEVLTTAEAAHKEWCKTSLTERTSLLRKIAQGIREKRAELIATMIVDAGKTAIEADVEISEAVDFCTYYASSLEEWSAVETLELSGKGPVLVTPPWNFPCAIPLGGVVAALAAGNSVIFKPAPEVTMTAWKTAEIFYAAGVDKKVVQFIACEDNPFGSMLIKDERISSVILTGATETAELFVKMRPGLDLMAETGGKNVLIATDLCDRDLAAKDIIQSAFGHAGQKCSACSIAILEKNLYQDKHFIALLKDTAASMKVGSAYDQATLINPLINPPGEKLKNALTTLEPGEEWLLEPQQIDNNPHLWSPGIKLNVDPQGVTFKTEFFGPVLALVQAEDLDEAIALAKDTPYGLTGGIHTLDKREQQQWIDTIEVGNAYVNRSITGAIVRRQPFGGCKASAYGRGLKAGGPNYITQLMNIEEKALPTEQAPLDHMISYLQGAAKSLKLTADEKAELTASLRSYSYQYENYFAVDHDPSQVHGQHNILRYKPCTVRLFIQDQDSNIDAFRSIAAALIARATISIVISKAKAKEIGLENIQSCAGVEKLTILFAEGDEAKKYIESSDLLRYRVISPVPADWQTLAAEKFACLLPTPVRAHGRLELLNYVRPMSLSVDYHRYGNLDNK